jgi:hypothetical protein
MMRDRVHIYYKDFMNFLYLSMISIWNFFNACIRFYYTSFHHIAYLERYGLLNYHGILDITGTFTAEKYLEPEGNIVRNKPAARIMGFLNNSTNNPSHYPVSSLAMDLAWKVLDKEIDYANTIFIDFGCGVGTSMMNAMLHKPFQMIFGIELNNQTVEYCKENIDRLQRDHSSIIKCNNTMVLNIDMMDFKLRSYVDSNHEQKIVAVLFMYEPLWTIGKADAHAIYRKILRNMEASTDILYIVYYFAGRFSGDATIALKEMNAELLHKEKYPTLFFGADEDMYIYKKICKRY